MKIRQIEFINALTLPGTKVLGATTISPDRLPNTKVRLAEGGLYVIIECSGKVGITPINNVRSAIVEDDSAKGTRKP